MRRFNLKFILMICLLVFLGLLTAYAQAVNVDAATMEVSGGYRQFKTFSKGVSAICACVGAIRVYSKFSSGDPDMRRGVLVWFGAALFAALLPSVLDALFR
ncbi:uncharacterized protein DUF4134 [Spirosoma oryzae]|uniref:Uncharacterized protein DUF4134 n=1 Tax=Spirosoma oryzae TaxID=1469603 RepID=A0A2T0S318_9BACT|nr:DUF4134 family protein [Spirosoma oryzae]PRY27814.1 uncharacterized protein DUF4134 [Spirosoma oryzae]